MMHVHHNMHIVICLIIVKTLPTESLQSAKYYFWHWGVKTYMKYMISAIEGLQSV